MGAFVRSGQRPDPDDRLVEAGGGAPVACDRMTRPPVYSIVIPTYRRPDMLAGCLESLCAVNYPLDALEVVVVDNGGAQNSRAAAEPFSDRVAVRYLVNRRNRGYGYSVNRGIVESAGDRVLLLNDDARPEPDLFQECDRLLASDS